MLGKCKECNSEAGYFKLNDGVCSSCINRNNSHAGKFQRLSKSMPVLTWLFPIFIIFQLSSPWIFQGIVSGSPEVAAAMNTPEIGSQFMFSIMLLVIVFVPLLISYIIRFFVARRRLHFALAWIILFVLFMPPIGIISMLKGGNPPSYTTIIFLIVAFKILRLDNLLINTGIKSKG
jgi:hypothetical protein